MRQIPQDVQLRDMRFLDAVNAVEMNLLAPGPPGQEPPGSRTNTHRRTVAFPHYPKRS